jgi:hypothetical protein
VQSVLLGRLGSSEAARWQMRYRLRTSLDYTFHALLVESTHC